MGMSVRLVRTAVRTDARTGGRTDKRTKKIPPGEGGILV